MHPLQNCLPVSMTKNFNVRRPNQREYWFETFTKTNGVQKKNGLLNEKSIKAVSAAQTSDARKNYSQRPRAESARAAPRLARDTSPPRLASSADTEIWPAGHPTSPQAHTRARPPPYASRVISEHTDLCQTTFSATFRKLLQISSNC